MAHVVIDGVVGVHAQEAAGLFETRMAQVGLPHINLRSLERLDDRLIAHLDGLSVAGDHAQRPLEVELEGHSIGTVFALTVRAIEDRHADSLDRLWALASDAPTVGDGLIFAFGWVERHQLQGIVRDLLQSADAAKRAAGLAACAMHRADPGLEAGPWLSDPVPVVRARAFRTAGELGLRSLTTRCVTAAADADPSCRFWAAWSAVLLGNRGAALDALRRAALENADGPHSARAFRLLLQAMDTPSAHAILQGVAKDPAQVRCLIQGSGLVGDTTYLPWLLEQMATPELARLAGEALTNVTGLDLFQGFETERPEGFESGPSENPEDENVELDPDEGLPWPMREKIEAWWTANSSRFVPGTRYFLGAPVTREHCIDVLENGYQRQRILAAHYLCLLNPGTPLFNTSAQAWRQQRLLAQMA